MSTTCLKINAPTLDNATTAMKDKCYYEKTIKCEIFQKCK